jgi:very-short-patch-repair endonuclease
VVVVTPIATQAAPLPPLPVSGEEGARARGAWEGEGVRTRRTTRARELRRATTKAEARLCGALRGRQLEGLKWRRQVPIDAFFADFLSKEARLVVELDGESHLDRNAYDERRTRAIEACGYQVVRFTNDEVLSDLENVLQRILAEVRTARGLRPSPSHSAPPSGPLPLPGPGEEKEQPHV